MLHHQINRTKAQIVTAIEKATGRTFQFKVADRLLLSRLKVGDPVIADSNTKRVAVKLSGTADSTSKPDGGAAQLISPVIQRSRRTPSGSRVQRTQAVKVSSSSAAR